MIRGDDITPWNLLHGGTIVRLEEVGADGARVWIALPLVDNRAFLIALAGCTRLAFRPYEIPLTAYDTPSITEFAAIVARRPKLRVAVVEFGGILVSCDSGTLFVKYDGCTLELDTGAPITIAELRATVHAWWTERRARRAIVVHPEINAILDGRPMRDAFAGLMTAWRAERTSDLAFAIEIVDERIRGAAPVRLDGPAAFDTWCATWSSEPGAALAELARHAQASWDDPPDKYDAGRIVGTSYSSWVEIARCASSLRSAQPDPRIGRGIEDVLEGPYNHWFHQIGVPPNRSSFADHAFALLDVHADAGTAARLLEKAERCAVEADCNGAEAVDRLRSHAEMLAARYPEDTTLAGEIAIGIRSRVEG